MLMPRYHPRQRGTVTLGSLLSGYPLKVGRFCRLTAEGLTRERWHLAGC
jgi:hypothetical protein